MFIIIYNNFTYMQIIKEHIDKYYIYIFYSISLRSAKAIIIILL